MWRMTEGALANGYRGAKMAPGGEVVDRSGDAASRRLTSQRPSVASGQPDYRYRGYYKNCDFSPHNSSLVVQLLPKSCFRRKLFLPISVLLWNSIRKKHAVLEILKML